MSQQAQGGGLRTQGFQTGQLPGGMPPPMSGPFPEFQGPPPNLSPSTGGNPFPGFSGQPPAGGGPGFGSQPGKGGAQRRMLAIETCLRAADLKFEVGEVGGANLLAIKGRHVVKWAKMNAETVY